MDLFREMCAECTIGPSAIQPWKERCRGVPGTRRLARISHGTRCDLGTPIGRLAFPGFNPCSVCLVRVAIGRRSRSNHRERTAFPGVDPAPSGGTGEKCGLGVCPTENTDPHRLRMSRSVTTTLCGYDIVFSFCGTDSSSC